MKKIFKEALFVLLGALLIECALFSRESMLDKLTGEPSVNIVYESSDIQFVNYLKDGNSWVSGFDPQVLVSDVNRYVKNIQIVCNEELENVQISFFYIENESELFSPEKMICTVGKKDKNEFEVASFINSFRVDLGETEGFSVSGLKFVVNPVRVFSFSRVIAILILYSLVRLLFAFQSKEIV